MRAAVTERHRIRRAQHPMQAHPMGAHNGLGRLPRFVAMTSLVLAAGIGCAHAGPCSADIAKIEKVLNEPNSPFGPTGRQTVGAQPGNSPRPPRWHAPSRKRDRTIRPRSHARRRSTIRTIRPAKRRSRSSRRSSACDDALVVTGKWACEERSVAACGRSLRLKADRPVIYPASERTR